MKPIEVKREFIELRAAGKSYAQIADALHISKSTCTAWERELSDQISDLRRAQLGELCESYGIAKEARIKNLGDTLDKINAAISEADFTSVDPAKLLEYKLKYTEALKAEYAGTLPAPELEQLDARGILALYADLLARARDNDITTRQAQKESAVLSQLLKAYAAAEVDARINELNGIIDGRGITQ